jgi:hypothetical protein
MSGDTDVIQQAFMLGFDDGFQSAIWACHLIQFLHIGDCMQLEQVKLINTKFFKRAAQLGTGGFFGSLLGFAADEESVAFFCQPGSQPDFCLPLARGDIDMVDIRR